MKYRINSGNWIEYFGHEHVDPVAFTGNVVVTIDPGKTNLAAVIGTTTGSIIEWIEVSGTGCDTTDYCHDLRTFLAKRLEPTIIKHAGIEQAVSYKGMQYYKSQMVLTEIRANLLNFFNDNYGFKPVEINNYSWKSAILPQGYRGTSEKGSLRYLNERGLTGVTHDVTDCICMYYYMIKNYPDTDDLYCFKAEESLYEYTTSIFPLGMNFNNCPIFELNPRFTLSENIGFYINKTVCENFVIKVPIAKLTLRDIYGSDCFIEIEDVNNDEVRVVVVRQSYLFGKQ